MNTFLRLPGVLLASLAACTPSAFAQTSSSPADIPSRVAAQNVVFEDFYQNLLRENPTFATAVGDYRYNNQLGDLSLAAQAREHAESQAFLARLKAIPTDGMGDTDRLSHALLDRQLSMQDEAYSLKLYEMPVNQQRPA